MLRVSSVYHLLLAMSDAPEGFDEKSHHKHLKLSILSSLIVLNLLSNLCSILAILRRKQGKLTRMYFFLLHLSIADILVAFSSLLPDLILTSVGGSHFPGGNAMCKTVKFIQMFGPYLSSYILVMIAMDRFQAICYPMTNRFWQPSRSKLKIVIAWGISSVLCIPQAILFVQVNDEAHHEGPTCQAQLGNGQNDWGARVCVTWFTLSNFVAPLVALSFYYVRICSKIRRNLIAKKRMLPANHQRALSTKPSGPMRWSSASPMIEPSTALPDFACSFRPRAHSLEGISRAKIKSVKQTIVVIVGYVVCSVPAVVIQLWAAWIQGEHQLDHCTEWFFWLVTLNSIMNPWIYIALNRDLQLSLFDCCCSCCPSRREAGHSTSTGAQTLVVPQHTTSSLSSLRPRSNTTSMVPKNGNKTFAKCGTKPFSNGFIRNHEFEVPMRRRLHTFQL